MPRPLAMLLLAGAVLVPSVAGALEATTAPQAPVAISAAAPSRQALIVAPAPGGGAVAADGEAYAALLRRLGFTLTVVIAEDRPELEAELRRFAASVKPGADVAVFVLGTALSHEARLYLIPRPAPPALAASLLASEGVALDDLLRRVGDRGAKEIVAIIDVCRPVDAADTCQQAVEALPDGVSAVVASRHRGGGSGGGAPLARMASLRPDLLPLLTKPDMSVFALYGALKGRLDGTDLTLEATPSLSRTFAFLPGDFLAKLPTPCNGVEATGNADALRGRHLDDLQAACAEAARTYDFSPYFADKLAILREQIAFLQAADAGCASGAMDGFLRDHPKGRLREAAGREITACDSSRREAEQRERAEQAAARDQALSEQILRDRAERTEASARREAEFRAAETEREARAREEQERERIAAMPPRARGNGIVARGFIEPSFVCTTTIREPVAQLICADADLASADAALGRAYKAALAAAATPDARRSLIQTEGAWLRQRNVICGIPTSGSWSLDALAPAKPCLLQQTRQRTVELQR